MPEISVIVPVYKVEPYLRRCVDSILNQTFTDFELILVDDGSPDNCPAICDEYAALDPRVRVIHQENGGLSAARNAGIDWAFANSNSQWITFIDSDDWVHLEYLERLYDAVIECGTSISICGYVETTGEEYVGVLGQSEPINITPERFYVDHIIGATIACAKLYNKSCFSNIRYPIGKVHEDEFVTYRILFCYRNVTVIYDSLYYYYINSHGVTKSAWTPDRLVSIEAKEQQISFFDENGFREAYIRSINALLWNIAGHIRQSEVNFKAYSISLRKLLRRKINQFRYILNLSVGKDYAIYEVAYPVFMRLYWFLRVVLNKLHIGK